MKKHSSLFKVSLLSISLLSALAQAVSAAFPAMYKSFPNESVAAIETLGTIPNFGTLFGLLVSPFLIRLTNKKTTVLIGLLLALISGVFPMIATSYFQILISRIFLGIGMGLFASLAVSMIADYFEGDELSSMLGFQNAMGSVGSGLCSLALGYLLTFGWQAAFSIYFLAIPAIILFAVFVPSDKKVIPEKVTSEEKVVTKQKLTLPVFLIAAVLFLFFIFLVPMSYKMPQLVVSKEIGTASDASTIYGIFTLIGIPVSIGYGYLKSKIGQNLYPLSLLCLAVGFGMMGMTTNLMLIYLAGIINGIGFGLAVPFGYNWISEVAEKNSINLATTVALLSINMGVFLSPVVINGLGAFLTNGQPDSLMYLSAIGFVSLMVVVKTLQIFLTKNK
ncbi:MFS transporter [Streptococcus ovis]|uniref:MFS transporter n=1 Tax=Streptococcus ovis TaxID=82806 RepID=UPI0003826F40|nr:MFS transporter [Streptococcus ovis]